MKWGSACIEFRIFRSIIIRAKMTMADDEDEMTNCSVCFEAYEEDRKHVPRILPCHHTICEQCVADLLKFLRGKTFIVCPECRKKYDARNGVKTFSQNKYIVLHIRKEKAKQIERDDTQRQEKSKAVVMSSELCSVHNRVANIYCVENTCQHPICPWCLKANHKNHNFEDLQELKVQLYERLMVKLESLAENLQERKQKLNAKYADVGKTIAEFNSNSKIRADLMYDQLRAQMANQMSALSSKITENMNVTEEQIDLVKSMRETIDKSTITLQDITDKLRAANNIVPQTCDKIQRKKSRANKRCGGRQKSEVTLEEEKILPMLSGLSLQEENARSLLKCTEIRAIYTKYETIGCPFLMDDRTVLVFGEENGQAIIYEYNSPPVDVIKRQIDDVAGCLVQAALFHNTWLALPHSDGQTIEFITDSARVSKFVTPCNPSALCVGPGSMLFFVDELTSYIYQLDCSKMPTARVPGFTSTQETKIYDLSYLTHQNKDLIVTTNGESGVSAYRLYTGELQWNNMGKIPGTEKVMNACGVATNRRGHIFVCDSANECIQLFSTDGRYLGEAFRKHDRGRPHHIRWFEHLSRLVVTYELAGKWSVHVIKVE